MIISEFFIILTHSYACNHRNLLHFWILFANQLFHLLHHTTTESHMLTSTISARTKRKLVSEYMHFSYNCCFIQYGNEVFFSREILWWNTKSCKTKNSSIFRINELEKIFMSSARFIELYIENRIHRIVFLGTNLTRRDIITMHSARNHIRFSNLAKIRHFRTCENLTRWNITIHTIQSDIFRNHCLEFCHQWDKCRIIIWFEFSPSPYFFEFRMWSHYEWIHLEFIRTKIRIRKYGLHRFSIEFWCCTQKSRHHVSHYLETRILEKSRRSYGFSIAMSTLVHLIDAIDSRLVSYLHPSHPVATQSNDFFLIDPIRTRLDRNPNHTTFCSLISFFCFFERFWWNPLGITIIYWRWKRRSHILSNNFSIFLISECCMCIINILDEIFLVFSRVNAPSSSYNTDIAFYDRIPCHSEWLETILHLTKWVKLIQFGTLYSRLIRNITLWEVIIGRTIDALPWTSPELRQKRNHRNSRKWADRTLAKDFSNAQNIFMDSIVNEFLISWDEFNRGRRSFFLVFRENRILQSVEVILCHYRFIGNKSQENLVEKLYIRMWSHGTTIKKIFENKRDFWLLYCILYTARALHCTLFIMYYALSHAGVT